MSISTALRRLALALPALALAAAGLSATRRHPPAPETALGIRFRSPDPDNGYIGNSGTPTTGWCRTGSWTAASA
jgi:hypothetical protein